MLDLIKKDKFGTCYTYSRNLGRTASTFSTEFFSKIQFVHSMILLQIIATFSCIIWSENLFGKLTEVLNAIV